VFGAARGIPPDPRLVAHASLADSRQAFAAGAILVVPLRIASGVRVKILEAWARGVPVVATREAAAGLEAGDGKAVQQADDPGAFARAIGRLHADRPFARASVAAGRALLEAHHDPARVATRLAEVYAEAARTRA
jgi:glycosyltransferase involved in cell wall biosynthesis